MSQTKEIEAIFQVSEVLLKAFEQIHQITGDFINRNKQKKQEKSQEPTKAPQSQEKKNQERKKQKTERPKHPESEKPKKDDAKPKQDQVKPKESEEKQSKKEKLKDKKEKKKQHPDKPKYPLSGYFRFNQENLEKIKKEYPELAQKELVALSSILWNKLSDEEKKPYEQKFEKDKKTYNVEVEKFYKNHPEERPKNKSNSKSQ